LASGPRRCYCFKVVAATALKPLLLGCEDPAAFWEANSLKYDLQKYAEHASQRLGEVITYEPVARDAACYLAAIAPLEKAGFFPRKDRWGLPDFTAVAGSVASHEDGGLGLVLSWIVYAKPLGTLGYGAHGCDAEILTHHGNLGLSLGDIFLFNADQLHAWNSNYACVLLQVAVGRRRPGRAKVSRSHGAPDGCP
jgi:hypothetical protein